MDEEEMASAMSFLGEGARTDERALWMALLCGVKPRYAGPLLGIPNNRMDYLCLKWSARRIYNYGVVCDLGWPEFGNEHRSRRSIRRARAK